MKALLPLIPALLLAGGCATVESSNAGGHHMISIKNTGWWLFNMVPLASGDAERPNTYRTNFFDDTTDLKNNILMLDQTVKNTGARGFRNLSSSIQEENVLFFLFSRRTYHTSAELVFDSTQTE